jgi:hypothetical protein
MARKRSSKGWGSLAAHDDLVSGKTDYNSVVDRCVLCPWKLLSPTPWANRSITEL